MGQTSFCTTFETELIGRLTLASDGEVLTGCWFEHDRNLEHGAAGELVRDDALAAFAPARRGCAAPPGQLIGHCIHERYGLVIVIKQAGNAVYIPGLAVLRDRIHLARAVRRHVRGHTQGPRGSLNVRPDRLTRPVARFIMRMGKNIRRACNGP